MGKRLGQARTQAEADAGKAAFELPSYTTAKLVAYWRISPTLRLTLDVDNLFDKTYYTSSYSRLWVTPGTADRKSTRLNSSHQIFSTASSSFKNKTQHSTA